MNVYDNFSGAQSQIKEAYIRAVLGKVEAIFSQLCTFQTAKRMQEVMDDYYDAMNAQNSFDNLNESIDEVLKAAQRLAVSNTTQASQEQVAFDSFEDLKREVKFKLTPTVENNLEKLADQDRKAAQEFIDKHNETIHQDSAYSNPSSRYDDSFKRKKEEVIDNIANFIRQEVGSEDDLAYIFRNFIDSTKEHSKSKDVQNQEHPANSDKNAKEEEIEKMRGLFENQERSDSPSESAKCAANSDEKAKKEATKRMHDLYR